MRISFFAFFLYFGLANSLFADDSCQTAILENLDPSDAKISVQSQGENEIKRLQGNDFISPGDLLTTDANTTVDIRLCEGTVVRIGTNTQYRMEAAEQNQGALAWLFSLFNGSVHALVSPSNPPGIVKFRLQTPSATIGVRGTEFLIESGPDGDSKLYTMDGEVLMGAKNQLEALRNAHRSEVLAQFQSVSRGMASSISRGQTRASPPKHFETNWLKDHRLFRSNLQIIKPNFKAHMQTAREGKKSSSPYRAAQPEVQKKMTKNNLSDRGQARAEKKLEKPIQPQPPQKRKRRREQGKKSKYEQNYK